MNTPIYDRLVAELHEQRATTVAFPRPAAPVLPAPAKPRDWFAPPAAEPTPRPGFADLMQIMTRIGTSQAQQPAQVALGLGSCYADAAGPGA
ncbi:hypothetical protein [Nonomuraea dietziae]|uniref:hypothetical protein n=1 Tax=Nonomuraea dietziae TaxID=65515 RepID=UPI0033E9A158